MLAFTLTLFLLHCLMSHALPHSLRHTSTKLPMSTSAAAASVNCILHSLELKTPFGIDTFNAKSINYVCCLSNCSIYLLLINLANVLSESIGNVISADQLTAKSIYNLCINFIINGLKRRSHGHG